VNPSLTITALAEHAMSHVPAKATAAQAPAASAVNGTPGAVAADGLAA
jgi:hypothetical protein